MRGCSQKIGRQIIMTNRFINIEGVNQNNDFVTLSIGSNYRYGEIR